MLKFTDTYVQTIARGIMAGDEQLLGAISATKDPFIKLGPFFTHHYLVLSTNRRLILVNHRKGLLYDRLDHIEAFEWAQVEDFSLAGMLVKKNLKIRAGARALKLKLTGWLGPMKQNTTSIQQLTGQFQQLKSLPPPAHNPQMYALT